MPDEWQYPHPPHGLPPRGPANPPPPPPAVVPGAPDAVIRLEALRLAVKVNIGAMETGAIPGGTVREMTDRYFAYIKTGEWIE